jgi:hypothetical protein
MHDELSQRLNLETGKITWPELQRYFARGVIIIVSEGNDLVEVAAAISRDDKNEIETLIDSGQIVRATDQHAKDWQAADPLFWAVVVAPWVVVQEIRE